MQIVRTILSVFFIIGFANALTNSNYAITTNTNTPNSISIEWNTAIPAEYTFKLTEVATNKIINQIEDTKFTTGIKQITIGDLTQNKEYLLELTANSIDKELFAYKKTLQTNTKKPNATSNILNKPPQHNLKNTTNSSQHNTNPILAQNDPKNLIDKLRIKGKVDLTPDFDLTSNGRTNLNQLRFSQRQIIYHESFEESLEAKGLTLCKECIQFSNDGKIGRSARIAPLEMTTYTGQIPDGWKFNENLLPTAPQEDQAPIEQNNNAITLYGPSSRDVQIETLDQIAFANQRTQYQIEITAKGNSKLINILGHLPTNPQQITLNGNTENQLSNSFRKFTGTVNPTHQLSESTIYSKIAYRIRKQDQLSATLKEAKITKTDSTQDYSLKIPQKLQRTGSIRFFIKPVFWQTEPNTILEIPTNQNYLKLQIKNNQISAKTNTEEKQTNVQLDNYEFTQVGISYTQNNAKIYINNELKTEIPINEVTGDLYLASNSRGGEKSKAYFDELMIYSDEQTEFCLNCEEKIQTYKTTNQVTPPVGNQRIYLSADDNPKQNDLQKLSEITITTFKGARITTPFLIYSEIPLTNTEIKTTELINEEKQTISAEIKVAYRWTQRLKTPLNPEDITNRKNPIYQEKIPELLVKNDQITKYEELQNRAPAEPNQPYVSTKLDAFKNKEVWLSAEIPKNTRPGTYQGSIEITNNNAIYTLPLTINVKDVTLTEDPNAANGIYYKSVLDDPIQPRLPNGKVSFDRDNNGNQITYPWINSKTIIQKELEDIKLHGFDSIQLELQTRFEAMPGPPRTPHSSTEIISKLNSEILTMAKNAGLTKRIIYLCGATEQSKTLLQTITQNILGQNYQDAYCYGVDEANTYQQIHAGNVRKLEQEQYIFKQTAALPLRRVAECNPPYGQSTDKINRHPEVDNRCPQYDMSFYSPNRDGAFEANLNYFKRLAQNPNDETQFTNDQGHVYPYEGQRGAGIYHPVGRENYARNQVLAGLFMWTTTLKVYWPYVYDHKSGNPYDDNDIYDPNTKRDQISSYPTTGAPINTIQWEYVARGITDNKILWNLENQPKTAPNTCRRQANAAAEYAAQLRTKYAQLVILSKDLGAPAWDTPEQLQRNLQDLESEETHALNLLETLQKCEANQQFQTKTSKTTQNPLNELINWLTNLLK